MSMRPSRPTTNVTKARAKKLIPLLKRDPTGTTPIQQKFLADIVARNNQLVRDIRKLIVDEDAFGLNRQPLQFNVRFAFDTDANKVAAFQQWLQDQINAGLLSVDPATPGQPWTTDYVRSAYKKAAVDAYIKARPELAKDKSLFLGGKEEFLRQAFDSPVGLNRIKLLATRAFESLKGITANMASQLNTLMADGLARGRGPRDIARDISKTVDGINKKRAVTIARTETVNAYTEGTLDSFERLGVQEVGIQSEWLTAGDARVCPRCAANDGVVFKVSDARGLIPLHPNCRCAWLPFLDDRQSTKLRGKTSPHPKKRDKAFAKAKEAGADL